VHLVRLAGFLVAAALLIPAGPLSAQCADGSPPPCASRSAAPATAAVIRPDRNRIAVLPFRVTTADSLLGEGFAELLAPEFTGEGGPRAIDMSTTLNAWRRAGGGLRSPLSQESANKVARDVGAGLVAQGSIVGFGGRLTVQRGRAAARHRDGTPERVGIGRARE
jgi:hypothetical protein